MSINKLQVKVLSRSGELLRCINCHAGQITVLRAVSVADLQPFQRFFAGVAGPEKMVATLDEDEYTPERAALVGFGESFGPDINIASFFEQQGFPFSGLEMILRNFGIDHPTSSICKDLTPDVQKRLRLIGAINSVDKVIILNNPFQDIASEWRERFAEEFALQTRSKSRIIIVPSLQYRPECWIDNDLVARVQVGENRQRTIGFGSAPNEMNDLVAQLRSAMGKEEEVQQILDTAASKQQEAASTAHIPPAQHAEEKSQTPQKKTKKKRRGRSPLSYPSTFFKLLSSLPRRTRVGLVVSAVVLAVGLNAMLIYLKTPSTPPVVIAKKQAAKKLQPDTRKTQVVKKPIAPKATMQSNAPAPPSLPEAVAPAAPIPHREQTEIAKLIPEKNEPRKAVAAKQPAKHTGPTEKNLAAALLKARNAKPNSSAVLDLYPASVRESIVVAFNNQSGDRTSRHAVVTTSTTQTTRKKDDFFSLLQSTSDTGKDLPPTVDRSKNTRRPPAPAANRKPGGKSSISTLSREEIEERRRKIRAKFLEAIEKRAQQRGK